MTKCVRIRKTLVFKYTGSPFTVDTWRTLMHQ